MTFEEIKKIPDLQVNVTPEVEDAFYFLHSLESELPEKKECETDEEYCDRLETLIQPSINAGLRLRELSTEKSLTAINEAYRMIDNLKKYGVACAAWV